MKLTNFKVCYSFFIPAILVYLSLLNEEEATVIEKILEEQECKEATVIEKILEEQECKCGTDVLPVTNNGSLVETGSKYPWTIALLKNNIAQCGGALITKDFAITAAHCLLRPDIIENLGGGQCLISKKPQNCFESKENLEAGFMHKYAPKIGRHCAINQFYVHPQYVPLKDPNDIALLHLAEPASCGVYERPICLSFRQEDIKPRATVKMAGWGPDILHEGPYNKVHNKTYVYVLTEVELTLWENERCEKEKKVPNTFCATGKDEGACIGDSGSAVFLRKGNVYYAVGITSVLHGNACQNSVPAYFTKILAFKSWIEWIVGKNSSSG